jgi:hypothetical protein
MDLSQVTTVELHSSGAATGSGRRRPPKLKSMDRTVSMIVDNYTPLTSAALSARNAGPLVINMDEPPPSSRRSSPNINNDDIFRVHNNQISNSMENTNYNSNEDYPPPPVMRKSSSFRRGETIDMMDLPSIVSTSLQHLRKAPSFNSSAVPDDDTIQIVPLSRHYSVRHHTTVPSTFKSSVQSVLHHSQQQKLQQQLQNASSSSSSARRNCSMHRSFHEPQRRQSHSKREIAVKSNSFSSDEQIPSVQQQHMMFQQQQQHSSMPFPLPQKKHSIEGDLYRSRSNSRSNSQGLDETPMFLDVWKPSPMPSPQPGHSRKSPSPRPSSSNSLDQVLNQGSVNPRAMQNTGTTAKMLRHQHTVAALNPQFLAPIPLLALDKSFDNVFQVKSPVFDMKKSYSLKYKNGPSGSNSNSKDNRELFKSRKSKSFITDTDPLDIPFALSPSLSPAALSASGSIKKHHSPMISPLPQNRNKLLLDEIKRRSGDGADLLPPDPSSFPIDFGTLDFNTIYKSYRAQQKTSTDRRQKSRRKKSSSSIEKKADDDDTESIAKRKRITCIVMTVFLGLVLFAVLAVIVTLTHASVVQVNNQTIPSYTFIRNKDYRPGPVHHKSPVGGGN